MQLNVAASRVADAIGCGGTIARSSIGSRRAARPVHGGRPGKTFFDIARGSLFAGCLTARNSLSRETCRVPRSNGKLDAMRANLMRELSKMEWADVLSGRWTATATTTSSTSIRKPGPWKITGIDNDASFGPAGGHDRRYLSRPTPRQQKFLDLLQKPRIRHTEGRAHRPLDLPRRPADRDAPAVRLQPAVLADAHRPRHVQSAHSPQGRGLPGHARPLHGRRRRGRRR